MSDIGSLVDGWNKLGVDSQYFIGHPSIPLKASDYRTKGIRAASQDFKSPDPVLFRPDITAYGIVLSAPRKGANVNAAVIGFNSSNGYVDCLQIQGGFGRYRELTPVRWDELLLDHLIMLGREADLEAVTLVPARSLDTENEIEFSRMLMRYDGNAMKRNFRMSHAEGRLVLELRKS
jgi:hypothetical protein